MSYLVAIPELVQGAAQDLAGIGSSLADATATVSGPTTGVAAAAQDEVSIAIASLFGDFGQEFQTLSAQAQAFHTQFVNVLNASAGGYVSAEAANAQQTLLGAVSTPAQAVVGGGVLGNLGQSLGALTGALAGAPGAAQLPFTQALASNAVTNLIAPWQQVFTTTTGNAQTVFAASQQALTTLSSGVSTEFNQLFTSPTTSFGNLQNALQSVALVGAPDNLQSAVTQHTLGGMAEAMGGRLGNTLVNDAHYQLWLGLLGDGFNPGQGLEANVSAALANFASSPLSGVIIGAVGPVVSPGVQLLNNAGIVVSDLTGGNLTGALTELVNTPADTVNAFFNGATLNLDALAPVFNPFVSAGDDGGQTLNSLSLAFGGLFSPGQVAYGASGPMYNGTGGSFLNSLGMDFTFSQPDDDAGATLAINGIGVGPIAATANLLDIFGQELAGNLVNSSAVGGYGPI